MSLSDVLKLPIIAGLGTGFSLRICIRLCPGYSGPWMSKNWRIIENIKYSPFYFAHPCPSVARAQSNKYICKENPLPSEEISFKFS